MVLARAAQPAITERDAMSRTPPCPATADHASLLPIARVPARHTRMGDRRFAPDGHAVVRGLTSTRMFALAVGLYRQHRRDGGGRCLVCGTMICRSRRHAATVIESAGVNPADVD